jgi:hypothetical protein
MMIYDYVFATLDFLDDDENLALTLETIFSFGSDRFGFFPLPFGGLYLPARDHILTL